MEGYLILVETRPNTYRHGWCISAERATELVVTFGDADILRQQHRYPDYLAYKCTSDQYAMLSRMSYRNTVAGNWTDLRNYLDDMFQGIQWSYDMEVAIDEHLDQRNQYAVA